MSSSFISKKIIIYRSTEIKEVQNRVYFGQEISSNNIIGKEINRRPRNRWNAFGKNNSEEQCASLFERKMFNECLFHALIYRADKTDDTQTTNNTDKYEKMYARHK